MRATFATLWASRVPTVVGLCGTANKTRFMDLANEAQQRLLIRGEWWGTYQRIRLAAEADMVTWPRQVAAAYSVAVDDTPVKMRSEWFEFLELGWGIRSDDDGESDEGYGFGRGGTACTYSDLPDDYKIRLYIDEPTDAGKEVLLQGYDDSENWILTDTGATNGEIITLAYPFATSTTTFRSLVAAQKDLTLNNVRVYWFDPATSTQAQIGVWEPDELLPSYRRDLIPGAADNTVTAMVKLDYIPLRGDTDFLLIQNIPALKYAMMAIQKEEAGLFDEATILMEGRRNPVTGEMQNGAIPLLEAELRHYLGPSLVSPLRIEGDTWGMGNIENLI